MQYALSAGDYVVIELSCGVHFGFMLEGELSKTVVEIPASLMGMVEGTCSA